MAAPVVYVDTSALAAVLIEQPESQVAIDWLDRTEATLVSSDLLEMDSVHLEAALRLDASAVLAYDHRLGQSARAVGLDVISPPPSAHPD